MIISEDSSSPTLFDSSAVINSTDFGAMSPSNHFTFQCPFYFQNDYLIPKGNSKVLISVGNSPMMKAVFLQCDLSYSSFVVKLIHKEVKNCLLSLLSNRLPLFYSFLIGTFLRNNFSLTSTEFDFGFPYRTQVNFSNDS